MSLEHSTKAAKNGSLRTLIMLWVEEEEEEYLFPIGEIWLNILVLEEEEEEVL